MDGVLHSFFLHIFIFLIFCNSCQECAVSRPSGLAGLGVIQLTNETFADFLNERAKTLVDFYDPNDKDWPRLKDALDGALRKSRQFGNRAPIARVDVKAEPALTQRFVPNGPFPQLMWFKHGKLTQYHRQLRSEESILKFLLALDRNPIHSYGDEQAVRGRVNRALLGMVPRKSEVFRNLEVVASRHMDVLEVGHQESNALVVKWIEDGKETVHGKGHY